MTAVVALDGDSIVAVPGPATWVQVRYTGCGAPSSVTSAETMMPLPLATSGPWEAGLEMKRVGGLSLSAIVTFVKTGCADVVAAGVQPERDLFGPFGGGVVHRRHVDHDARLADGDLHRRVDGRVVRRVRGGAGAGEIDRERGGGGRGARDRELPGISRGFGGGGIIRHDRDRAAVIIRDGDSRRRGAPSV